VVSSDFYSVCTSAGKKADGLVNLFCWARKRAVLRPGRGREPGPADVLDATVAGADQDAVCRARGADDRLGAGRGPAPGQVAAAAARPENTRAAGDAAIGTVDAARNKEMAAPGIQEPAKKALATLDREWDRLIAHPDYPMVSLDNNTAERAIRGPVVAGRTQAARGTRTPPGWPPRSGPPPPRRPG
jgi:transposase